MFLLATWRTISLGYRMLFSSEFIYLTLQKKKKTFFSLISSSGGATAVVIFLNGIVFLLVSDPAVYTGLYAVLYIFYSLFS